MDGITALRPALDGNQFDVVVIGGGISGVAIARETALHGRRTLLLEQNDFGCGTTSRSTRIIHGGLRYLEHGELGLVRESLRERERLLREQPHLVRPLQFLLALKPGVRHNALTIRAGLWLYTTLGGHHNPASLKSGCRAIEEHLDRSLALSVFCYEDAQCEFPELLVAEWLSDALQAGCEARNHVQVLAVEIRNGRVSSVRYRDQLDQSEQMVRANWVINATGPWCDHVCQQLSLPTRRRLVGGVRGSHIVLPSIPGMPQSAIYTEASDGRPFFAIPWNHQLLVGTTEVADDQDPGEARPSASEIEYLLRSLALLFPRQNFTRSDVRYAFAGVRPLPYSPSETAGSITRRHFFHDHGDDGAAGVISIVGGKLTTAASLARDCACKIGIAGDGSAHPEVVSAPLDAVESTVRQWSRHISLLAGISEASAQALAEWHGRRAMVIARLAAISEDCRVPLCQHTEHLVAEAVAAIKSQHAVTLGDVLLRRVPVALGACWSEECSAEAARKIGKAMGWTEAATREALDSLEQERIKFLNPSSGGRHPLPETSAPRVSNGVA